MLIIHHNDNDGKLGAVICALYGGWTENALSIKFLEMDYKDSFDPAAHLNCPDEQVILVDFSLRPEEMLVLLNYTQNIIWLDHHKTTMDKYVDFPYEIKGIREEGERAGCLLAWDYFVTAHNPEQTTAPLIVTLLSDYDTWTLKFEDSKYLNYGLQSVDTSPSGGLWNRLLMDDLEVKRFIEGGKFVLGFAQRRGKELAESYGYFAELDGANIFVMHNPNPGKDWFWLLRDNKADAYARVAFDGRRYMVSLYSEIIDVSVICKNHGGGGHPGAAGFVCKDLPFSPV